MRFFPSPTGLLKYNPSGEDNLINKDDIVEEGMQEERSIWILKEARYNVMIAQEDDLYNKLVET